MAARMILRPEDIFEEITDDFQGAFGTNLVSLFLYGSGASGDYVPAKSDLNFLGVLKEERISDLVQAIPVASKWRKKKVLAAFMTGDFILSSADSYPVEFLNMKLDHRMLFGPDVLSELTFEAEDLRLQLERELKGKIFHLQQGYLESEGKERAIRQLIAVSLGAFVPLFRVLLYLKGCEIPHGRREVITRLSASFPIQGDVFLKAADIREGKGRFPAGVIAELFSSYYEEVLRISSAVDRMEIHAQ